MAFWLLLLVFIGVSLLSRALLPPKRQKAGMTIPSDTSIGVPIPVLFGTAKVGGHTGWLGTHSTAHPVYDSVTAIAALFGEFQGPQIGWRYFADLMMVLCHGPVDYWMDLISYQGKRASGYGTTNAVSFSGSSLNPTVTPNAVISVGGIYMMPAGRATWEADPNEGMVAVQVYAPNFYGGRHQNGGIGDYSGGGINFYFGVTEQPFDTYMQANEAFPVPRNPGICMAVFPHTNLGQSNVLPTLFFELTRYPQMPGSGNAQVGSATDANGAIGPPEANPVHVIYEILTNPVWGLGYPGSLIDQSPSNSWIQAANQLGPSGDNLGISGVLDTLTPSRDTIDEILRTIDAVLFVSPTTGLLEIKLIRDDYGPVGSLPVVDETVGLELEYQQSGWRDTVNEVRVNFNDRARVYRPNQVTAQNLASTQQSGQQIISHTTTYAFIATEDVAQRLATRDLNALSVPLARCTIRGSRALFPYTPGSVFVLNWASYGVSGVVMRVMSITRGALADGTVEAQCIQDVFSLESFAVAAISGTPWVDPSGAFFHGAPDVQMVPMQGIKTGTLGLQITDPFNEVFEVQMNSQAGNNPPSGFSVVTGPPYSGSVGLIPQLPSWIWWIVSYHDQNGDVQTITGAWQFAPLDPTGYGGLTNFNSSSFVATAALPANTYTEVPGTTSNPSDQSTLIANANGALIVDGVAVSNGDSVLVTAEANPAHNGLYDVILPGDASHPYSLVRDLSMSLPYQLPNSVTIINSGNLYANTLWQCTNPTKLNVNSFVFGTTSITFKEITKAGAYDIACFWAGKPASSEKLVKFIADRPYVLPQNLVGSQFAIGVNPTATMTFTLLKNGSSIGTVAFSTGGVPTITFSTSVSFTGGDIFEVDAPGTVDATGADISATFDASLV